MKKPQRNHRSNHRVIARLGGSLAFVGMSLLVLSVSRSTASAADDAPTWLKQAAAAAVPGLGKDVPGIVLHDESRVTVHDDGRVVSTNLYAIKILTREGRELARAAIPYGTDSGKVREFRAWMIRPSGEVRKYNKDSIVDVADVDNDVYNEARSKIIFARDDAETGAVFGYEAVTEERSMFNQLVWGFQERLPVVVSRLTATFPADWRADSITFNHAKVEPSVTNSTYVWEMRDLAAIEPELSSPPVTSIAPWLAVSYFPSGNAKSGVGKTFASWAEVSRWMTELSEPQAVLDDNLASKAKQLSAAAKSEVETIQAIGRFVQSINYVSIQIGVGRFRPHSATEVFAKSYGDCKDKANLMRTMLRAVGIQSHLVLIHSGDPTYVREEWPSPQQFNHCVIAVKVGELTDVPTIVSHPSLGRLLIFDPTDDNTPVGDLPDHEQGSFALIVAGDQGALLRMPTTPPEANLLDRTLDVVLAADGSISGKVLERAAGRSAVVQRGEHRSMSQSEYVKMIEGWVARGAPGATVSKVSPSDNSTQGRFALDIDFAAGGYAQVMQGRLMVFKPAIVSRRESLSLTAATRKHPVVLEPRAYTETVNIRLPGGFDVDELPEPVKLDTSFGNYATTYIVKDGRLQFTRKLVVRGMTIPVADYPKVRSFYLRIRAAEQTPVVLAKK